MLRCMGNISRRTLINSAWSAPVVLTTIAAPNAVASLTNSVFFYWSPDSVAPSALATVTATIVNDSDFPSDGNPLFSASVRGDTTILHITPQPGWQHAGTSVGYDVFNDTPMTPGELVTIEFELSTSPNRAGEILYGGIILDSLLQMSAMVTAKRNWD